jgi:tetratricopeptide (TPR) repeat protein
MKKSVIILSILALVIHAGAQNKNIVGLWKFTEENYIMEFTENQLGLYGSDSDYYTDYKISGKKITVSSGTAKLKWQGKNTVIFTEGRDKIPFQRVIPDKNNILKHGIYYITDEDQYSYYKIIDESHAEYGRDGSVFPLRYFVSDSKLYMVYDGYAQAYEIKNDKTFQVSAPYYKERVFELISDEEFKEKNLYAEILGYYTQYDFDTVIELAPQAIAKKPNDMRFYRILGHAYSAQDKYQQAIDILNQAMQINPKDVNVCGNLSYYYLFVKDYESAEQSAIAGLNIDDSQLWIKTNLATALLFQNRYHQAESIFLELKDEICSDYEYKTCAEAWIEDFDKLEKADAIPPEQKQNVKKIRELLDWETTTDYTPLTDEQKEEIIEVVKTWFEEMLKASDVNRVMQISDVPFAFDKERVITTTEELKKSYLEIFEDKGQQTIPPYEVEIWNYTSKILDGCIPLNFVKVVVFMDDYEDSIDVSVIIRDNTFKVVGFGD